MVMIWQMDSSRIQVVVPDANLTIFLYYILHRILVCNAEPMRTLN